MTLELQKNLEADMRDMTISRFHRRHNNAFERGEFSDSTVGKGITSHLEQAMLDAVHAFHTEANSGKAGRRHVSVKMIDDIGMSEVAFLTTKAVVNTLRMTGTRHGTGITVQRLAFTIAGMAHDELALRYFQENQRSLLKAMLKDFDKRDMPRRRRKELIQRTMSKHQLEWAQDGWGEQNRLHFGTRMIELFRNATGCIEFADLHVGTRRQRKIVVATPELVEKVQSRMDHYEALFTMYLPTVIPPRKWENHNLFGGGYYTNNVSPYPLVKDSKKPYLEELENSDLTDVLSSVNALQDTAWRVNSEMLDITKWAYENHAERVGFPASSALEVPEKPALADTDPEVSKDYRKQCYLTHDTNRRNVAKRISILQAFSIADKMKSYDNIYFPHYLDSRGRAYPKPVILNPQGADHVKAMLEFGAGKEITVGSNGHAWLMIVAANTYGEDKLSLNDRIKWAQSNQDMILDIAAYPTNDHRWMDADEPFAFLRACLELRALAEADFSGRAYVSHMPVPVDATCSGIQHFSAMLRDEVGGKAVNLKALDDRQDVYQMVADRALEKLQHDAANHEDGEVRQKAMAAIAIGVNRKMTKRSTMIVPYNGTFHACMEYITEYYTDQGLQPWEPMSAFIPYVAKCVWHSIAEVVVAARGAMDWLTKVANAASKSEFSLPMTWTTPAGFPVRQVRYEAEQVRVKTFLDGKSCKLSYLKETDVIDAARMRSSVAPNFVHSMDAAHLQLTISTCLNAYDNGDVTSEMSFAMVHDSFGVHAADMEVFGQCIRKAFHFMYTEHDVLSEFLVSNNPIIDADKATAIPPLPQTGSLDLDEVLESEFFFS